MKTLYAVSKPVKMTYAGRLGLYKAGIYKPQTGQRAVNTLLATPEIAVFETEAKAKAFARMQAVQKPFSKMNITAPTNDINSGEGKRESARVNLHAPLVCEILVDVDDFSLPAESQNKEVFFLMGGFANEVCNDFLFPERDTRPRPVTLLYHTIEAAQIRQCIAVTDMFNRRDTSVADLRLQQRSEIKCSVM